MLIRRVTPLVLMLMACASEPVPPQHAPSQPAPTSSVELAPPAPVALPSLDDPLHPELPQIRTRAHLDANAKMRVELHGRYEITPIPQGKAPHPVFIVMSDGERVVRSYAPVPEERRFDHQPVIVIGHVFPQGTPVPGMFQQMGAHHIEVELVTLNPLASPSAESDGIMTPPTLSSGADIQRLHTHWVQIFGTLTALEPEEWEGRARAEVLLSDETRLFVRNVRISEWEPLVGKAI
jgi:hypothetical protein